MKEIFCTVIFFIFSCSFPLFAQKHNVDLNVFAQKTGNPIIPGYLADASLFYDFRTDTFLAYGTNDGNSGENVFPAQVWYSKDGKKWTNMTLTLPKEWTTAAGTKYIWAPSITYHPITGKYYLMYSIESKVFIAMADNALGPWEDANAVAPGKLFYKGYDGQFFLDDNQLYITTDAREFKILKLRADSSGKLYFDHEDPRFPLIAKTEFSGDFHYAKISNLMNAFEASILYKRKGLYYLMWSFQGSESYNVRYAVADVISGPYRELKGSMHFPILSRDDKNHILGPGHHSMMDYDGRTFIAYHRQHFPFVDSKRQTCIDEIFFNTDGSIKTVIPSHRGVQLRTGMQKKNLPNLALGRRVLVSSERTYDSSPYDKRYRTNDIRFNYSGRFAVDENYGTRWDAGTDAEKAWLIVDLGRNHRIDSTETIFEFTSRTYLYKLEYLKSEECPDINMVTSNSMHWKVFNDRSLCGAQKSPVVDFPLNGKKPVARYLRLTITGAQGLPYSSDGADAVNARNGLSVFEFKVFGK